MTDTADAHTTDAHTTVLPLTGRKAVITGGTTGIGRAIAVLLAAEGVEVFIGGTQQDHLDAALERIREVGSGDGMVLDLSEAGNVDRFLAAATDKLGSYDIAIANAAVGASGLGEMDEDELRRAIGLDFTAYLLTAHGAAKAMGDRGRHHPGRVDERLCAGAALHRLCRDQERDAGVLGRAAPRTGTKGHPRGAGRAGPDR